MKTKLKSGNALVRLLLLHGEKLLILLFAAAAGMLFYGSLGRERLSPDFEPSRLVTKANNADSHIRGLRWEGFPPEEKIDPADLAPPASTIGIVPRDAFPNLAQSINPPVIDPVALRTDPVLLPVADLEVHSGSGLWATANPELIKQKMRDAIRQQQLAEQERQREQERLENEGQDARGGRGGEAGYGRGGRGGFGEGGGMGEGRGMGGMAGFGGQITDSGAVVVPPTSGAPVQGFEDIQSRSWVTLLARIPIMDQSNRYEDALENARGFSGERDLPDYIGYQVERAEVSAEGAAAWQVIAAVNEKALVKVMETWPVQTPEIVNPKFVHPLLTYPLPPMVLRTWDKQVTHSAMPLPDPKDQYGGAAEEEQPRAPTEEEQPADSDDPFARRRDRVPPGGMAGPGYGEGMGRPRGFGGEGFGRGMEGGMGRPGGYGGEGFGRGMEGGMGRPGGYGGEGFGRGMEGGMMGGMRMGGAGGVTLPPFQWDRRTKQLLFRYFDTSVQPGKSYRYRVRLVLKDVNDGVPEANLEKTVQERVRTEKEKRGKDFVLYRFTDWSEPSPVASVPQVGLLFVAGAKPLNEANFASEPEVEILIKTLDAQHAAQVGIAQWFKRGSVLNLLENAKVIWAAQFASEGEEEPKFNFRTGVTLLDFDGGAPLNNNRELPAPTRALLMDAAGRLMLQDELDHRDQVDEYKKYEKFAEEAKRSQAESAPAGEGNRGRGPGGFGRGN
jgi:hypothetical protein